MSSEQAQRLIPRAARGAVATAALLILVKAVGWFLTGSLSILAALADSALDAVASLVNFAAIRYSLSPRDAQHRFGHGKAEALAGLAQALFIFASAFLILWQAARRFLHPVPIEAADIGIAITAFAML